MSVLQEPPWPLNKQLNIIFDYCNWVPTFNILPQNLQPHTGGLPLLSNDFHVVFYLYTMLLFCVHCIDDILLRKKNKI